MKKNSKIVCLPLSVYGKEGYLRNHCLFSVLPDNSKLHFILSLSKQAQGCLAEVNKTGCWKKAEIIPIERIHFFSCTWSG